MFECPLGMLVSARIVAFFNVLGRSTMGFCRELVLLSRSRFSLWMG
jgi:hypothetical protein